mmetsp:Transcript_23938/g.38862  ORF Transcript_23938/g.38862 Transcript_23938/m.38862 type:complete len:315 (-) Transcript_23938:892-1836(-)
MYYCLKLVRHLRLTKFGFISSRCRGDIELPYRPMSPNATETAGRTLSGIDGDARFAFPSLPPSRGSPCGRSGGHSANANCSNTGRSDVCCLVFCGNPHGSSQCTLDIISDGGGQGTLDIVAHQGSRQSSLHIARHGGGQGILSVFTHRRGHGAPNVSLLGTPVIHEQAHCRLHIVEAHFQILAGHTGVGGESDGKEVSYFFIVSTAVLVGVVAVVMVVLTGIDIIGIAVGIVIAILPIVGDICIIIIVVVIFIAVPHRSRHRCRQIQRRRQHLPRIPHRPMLSQATDPRIHDRPMLSYTAERADLVVCGIQGNA